MQRKSEYSPPVSPLIHTLWSCRTELRTLLANPSANSCQQIRKRPPTSKPEGSPPCDDLSNKRIRLSGEGGDGTELQQQAESVGEDNIGAGGAPRLIYREQYIRCHPSHDDPTDIELIQVLLGVVQDKRSYRLANMYGYSVRGSRRLRRLLSSMAQSVQEKNLHAALNDHYLRASAELQSYNEASTIYGGAAMLLDEGAEHFSSDSMDASSWYSTGEDHQFLSTESNDVLISAGWNGCFAAQQQQFVSEEGADLMDISRNTVTGRRSAASSLDWAAPGVAQSQLLMAADGYASGDQDAVPVGQNMYLYDSVGGEYCCSDVANPDVEAEMVCWEAGIGTFPDESAVHFNRGVQEEDPTSWRRGEQSSIVAVEESCGTQRAAPSEKGTAMVTLRSPSSVDFKSIAGMA